MEDYKFIIIGMFYDDEYTVKHSSSQTHFDFTYKGVQMVQDFCYNTDAVKEGDIYSDKMSCKASMILNNGGSDEAKKMCHMFKTNKLMRFHKIYAYFVCHKEMEEMKDGLTYVDHDLTERPDDVLNSES
eukprot:9063373-Ditylum_brightwellii.AAC.1